MVLACKFNDDLHLNNEDFAKVGGLSLVELNVLEFNMLDELQFDLNVSREEFERYLYFFGSRSHLA